MWYPYAAAAPEELGPGPSSLDLAARDFHAHRLGSGARKPIVATGGLGNMLGAVLVPDQRDLAG